MLPWLGKHLPFLTKIFVLVGTASYIVWDLVAYRFGGGSATESTTVGTWMSTSLWITLLVAVLVGHLMASGPTSPTWKHVLALVLGLAVGYLCTAYG